MNTDGNKSEYDKILEKLSTGMTVKQVIAEGHAKSTVYQVAKKLAFPDTSEVAELREKKAILKLKADIDDIESKREKLPLRIERLEKQMTALTDKLDRMFSYLDSVLVLCISQLPGAQSSRKLTTEDMEEIKRNADKYFAEIRQTFSETIKKA